MLLEKYYFMSESEFQKEIQRIGQSGRESLYLSAKDKYYSGDPIMPDKLFDALEVYLKSERSPVTDKVGGVDAAKSRLAHKHLTPMLSLEKVQVNDEEAFLLGGPSSFPDETGRMPLFEIEDFGVRGAAAGGMDPRDAYPLEATPKLDGSAIELQYSGPGRTKLLVKAVTRGENGLGAEVTDKFGAGKIQVPTRLELSVDTPHAVEVRGECVIPLDAFETKWKDRGDGGYKNARNMVAGVLGRPDATEALADIRFVAYSLKLVPGTGDPVYPANAMSTLADFGFESGVPVITVPSAESVRDAYVQIRDWRATAPYQTDGMVLKMPETVRHRVGETRHHPRWALAVKFPSNEATTTMLDIEWTVGYTGELSPTAVLAPVELDNTTVERASLYNVNSIISKGTMPGAIVSIRKAGEIIPQIVSVVKAMPQPTIADVVPKCCPACGSSLRVDTDPKSGAIHVFCENPSCIAKLSRKLHAGVSALKMMGIGESTCQSLVRAGINTIHDLLDREKTNIRTLVESGEFKKGRQLDLLLAAVSEPRRVELKQVVHALSYEGVGTTLSEQIAKHVAGVGASFENLERAKYEPWLDESSPERADLAALLAKMEVAQYEIVMPTAAPSGAVVFEMTGSPPAPFKTKSDFVNAVAAKGWVHGKISKASVLVAESLSKMSGKMKDAEKKGIRVMTYDQVADELGI